MKLETMTGKLLSTPEVRQKNGQLIAFCLFETEESNATVYLAAVGANVGLLAPYNRGQRLKVTGKLSQPGPGRRHTLLAQKIMDLQELSELRSSESRRGRPHSWR